MRGLIDHRRFGIVAATCSHGKFAMVRRIDFDVHDPVSAEAGSFCGVIPDRVLIADILRDLRCNRVDFIE